MFGHLYKYEFNHFTSLDSALEKLQPQAYKSIEKTTCHFATSLEKLVELNEKLLAYQEFTVDLEHQYFLGLNCLMQISTHTKDLFINMLELYGAIVKVFHSANSDIQ